VPINVASFGDSLHHVLSDSGAEVVVVDDACLAALDALLDVPSTLITVVATGTGELRGAQWRSRMFVRLNDLRGDPPRVDLDPLDPVAVMYTSGTTGASKGVVLCHRYFALVGRANVDAMRLGPNDRYLTCLPLFHGMAQLSGTIAPLIAGADIVLTRKFSASRFLDTCRDNDVTAFGAIAAMTSMLYARPADARDRDHRLRYAFAVAVPATLHRPFEERFGVRLVGGFGLTEASMITYCEYDEREPGSSGFAIPHFEVEIHDEDDRRVPPGTVGEIVCRPRCAGAVMSGYHRRPQETLDAFRNLWLHTGDLGRMDERGALTFVDRAKDAIRRRGENISSFEVESAVLKHQAVTEVAAYAVPSELGEDEVMVAVVPSGNVTPEELARYCEQSLPRYAVPRYIRFVDAMPHTATNKVQKAELRAAGVTDDTWAAW